MIIVEELLPIIDVSALMGSAMEMQVQRAQKYRDHAKKARVKAKQVEADIRHSYILLAEGWQTLADAVERSMNRFNSHSKSTSTVDG